MSWQSILEVSNTELSHLKGSINIVADALGRLDKLKWPKRTSFLAQLTKKFLTPLILQLI